MKKIKLCKEIYSESSVQKAISAYKDYAKIQYYEENEYWILEFSKCRYEEEQTVWEFENYLIGIENS